MASQNFGQITKVWVQRQEKYYYSNQTFHYTRCITRKRVTSLREQYPRHCAWATQLLSKENHSRGEPLITLCLI